MKINPPTTYLRRSASITLLSVVLLFVAVIPSRSADFRNLLSGKTHPLAVKLGGLNDSWRRFTVHTGGHASGNVSLSFTGSSGTSGSSQNNIADLAGSRTYLTQGETVAAGSQVYLVAYRMPGSGLDLSGLIQALASKTSPVPTVLAAETELPLSLLEVKSTGTLDDIRAFDLKREIAESKQLAHAFEAALKAATSAASTNNTAQSAPKSNK